METDSFLSDRRLFVSASEVPSGEYPLEYDVEQDSTLNRLIFLLYINDFYENVMDGLIVNYTDDISLIVTAPQQNELEFRV